MNKSIKDLCSFLDSSPSAWHAVKNIKSKLLKAGFEELYTSKPWKLKKRKSYFVSYNGSSICAFTLPHSTPKKALIVAAHTDSPALKLKPNCEYRVENMILFGVEVYGGPLKSSWMNRDLGIAGRILFSTKAGKVQEKLVNITTYPLSIPQLAIHLDRELNNKGLKINPQDHLPAIAALDYHLAQKASYFNILLKPYLKSNTLLGHDLFLYPLEAASLLGYRSELLSSYRIDNLASVHAGLTALLGTKKPSSSHIPMAIFWDNEEVGSSTAQGAGSPFLSNVLERITLSMKQTKEDYHRLCHQSLCLSVDMAHSLHPNYQSAHEPRHQPLLNKGVTLKINAQQRYASTAYSAALISHLCQKNKLNLQKFVVRTDMPCGSTIGPISSTRSGINTVDIGAPQLAMHAARELCACQDHLDMCKLLKLAFDHGPLEHL